MIEQTRPFRQRRRQDRAHKSAILRVDQFEQLFGVDRGSCRQSEERAHLLIPVDASRDQIQTPHTETGKVKGFTQFFVAIGGHEIRSSDGGDHYVAGQHNQRGVLLTWLSCIFGEQASRIEQANNAITLRLTRKMEADRTQRRSLRNARRYTVVGAGVENVSYCAFARAADAAEIT